MTKCAHSIWLTLDRETEARLHPLIAELATAHARSAFQAHITLLGGLVGDPEVTFAAMKRADWPRAATAKVTGVDSGESYFTALFLDVTIPEAFHAIRQDASRMLPGRGPGSYRPHVSLAYGPIAAEEKQRLIARFRREFAGVSFRVAGVSVVSASASTPVQDWRVLWRRGIGGEEAK